MDRALTIHKASAGSGKTYNLALEYIRLMLGVKNVETGNYVLNSARYCRRRIPARHRHILAITFTNKATEEMKERIVMRLHELAEMPSPGQTDAEYAARLLDEFGCTRQELCEAASLAMNELLYDYGGFNVSTIDSFFQQVLREFAREVDRQGDFEVELDEANVVSSGVAMMLDDLNYGNPARGARMQRWIFDYMLSRISESGRHNMLDRSSGLFANLVEFVGKSCSEDYKEYAAELQRYLADETLLRDFRLRLKGAVDDARSAAVTASREVLAAVNDAGCDKEMVNRYLLGYIENIQTGKDPSTSSLQSKTLQKVLDGNYAEEDIYAKGKCPVTGKGKSKTYIFPPASVAESLEVFVRAYVRLGVMAAIVPPTLKAADNLEFQGFALGYIEKFRRDNNLILLSDTNDLLDRIICDDDAPFIYERLGVALRHFLIDEFQDTSRMQWKNLRPLVSAGVCDRNDSLIIGDEKQAIYRFRNSDSSMLGHTVEQDDFPGRCRIKGNVPAENTNYRSAPDMVRFNNTVFARLAAALAVDGYGGVVQGLPKGRSCESEPTAYIRFAISKESDEALARMARHILSQHQAGYEWRDIAVLVRYKSEAAKIVEYLRANHPEISLLSEEALYLRNSSSVKLIVGMLKLLDRSYGDDTDPGRRHTASDTMAMISRYDYHTARGATPDEALHAALGDSATRTSQVAGAVNELRRTHATSLASLVEMIVRQRIPAEQRRSEMAFICAFQDMVAEYCKCYPDSVHDFLKWYDAIGRERALPGAPDVDAVSIMTIHKSKGLEWPCVHLPVVQWELTRQDTVWFHPVYPGVDPAVTPPIIPVKTTELFGHEFSPYRDEYNREMSAQRTDNLNLIYVAFTRAARELIISTDGSGVGEYVLQALQRPMSESEYTDGLHLDTSAFFNEDRGLEIGKPTQPEEKEIHHRRTKRLSRIIRQLPDYEVFERDDTRELVAMPDITTALGVIGEDGTDGREIVDPVPDGCGGEELRQRSEAARRGTLLHAVMAEMERRTDLDRALGRVANAMSLGPDETDRLRRLLGTAIDSDDPRVDRWFDPDGRLLSEQRILLPDGTVLIPDRIILHPDGSVDVVDYKFTSAMRVSHQQQLRSYCLLLRSMGYKQVSGHLWYPLLGKIATEKIESQTTINQA